MKFKVGDLVALIKIPDAPGTVTAADQKGITVKWRSGYTNELGHLLADNILEVYRA